MKGLLVRVGIDATSGNWNAPVCKSSGAFAYVTIPEMISLRPGIDTRYDEFVPAVKQFGQKLPISLLGNPTHLDPDFSYLTYGDQGQHRAKSISKLGAGDMLVFFAGLRAVDHLPGDDTLVYALIGIYIIEEIVPALSVPRDRWHENAHTRRREISSSDIVVRARPGVSGRLKKCIPIGEFRDRAYRVRRDLLSVWGDLNVKDGYIQRSARLPEFMNAPQFYRWFNDQKPELVATNNLEAP